MATRKFFRQRYYVGLPYNNGEWEVFKSDKEPTQTDFPMYAAVTGAFRTKRGAEFMAKHGQANPHCQTVRDAERLSKRLMPSGEAI